MRRETIVSIKLREEEDRQHRQKVMAERIRKFVLKVFIDDNIYPPSAIECIETMTEAAKAIAESIANATGCDADKILHRIAYLSDPRNRNRLKRKYRLKELS